MATKVTAVRIALIPLIIFFYVGAVAFWQNDFFAYWGRFIALILFLVALITDWLDGQIARKFNQVSAKGEWLDNLADKLLVVTGLLLIFTDPILNHEEMISIIPMFAAVFVGLAIIGSDIAADAVKKYGQGKGMTLSTGLLDKFKLAFQFTGIGLFMLYAVNYRPTSGNLFFPVGAGETILTYFAWSALGVAAVLSVINVIYLEVLYFKGKEKEKSVEED